MLKMYVTFTIKKNLCWPFFSGLSQTDYPLTFDNWNFITLHSLTHEGERSQASPTTVTLAMLKTNIQNLFVI